MVVLLHYRKKFATTSVVLPVFWFLEFAVGFSATPGVSLSDPFNDWPPSLASTSCSDQQQECLSASLFDRCAKVFLILSH